MQKLKTNVNNLIQGKLGNTIFVIVAVKLLGVIREGVLFILSIGSPASINLYFIAAQAGIGLSEGVFFKVFYGGVLLSIVYVLGIMPGVVFLSIAIPFLLWPKLLNALNLRHGLIGVIIASLVFNSLSIIEMILHVGFHISPVGIFEGTPILSLWLTVFGGVLLVGCTIPKTMGVGLALTMSFLVFVRLLLLLGAGLFEINYYIFALIRLIELVVPQFANYYRIFK